VGVQSKIEETYCLRHSPANERTSILFFKKPPKVTCARARYQRLHLAFPKRGSLSTDPSVPPPGNDAQVIYSARLDPPTFISNGGQEIVGKLRTMPRMPIESDRTRRRKEGEILRSTILLTSVTDFNVPKSRKPVFRPLGNPAPLGLSGFALTTMVLSLVNIQAKGVTNPHIAIGLGISLSIPY